MKTSERKIIEDFKADREDECKIKLDDGYTTLILDLRSTHSH